MSNDNTFVEITNKDIFSELQYIKKEISEVKSHVIVTNGKVKLNRLHITGLWGVISVLIGIIVIIVRGN